MVFVSGDDTVACTQAMSLPLRYASGRTFFVLVIARFETVSDVTGRPEVLVVATYWHIIE